MASRRVAISMTSRQTALTGNARVESNLDCRSQSIHVSTVALRAMNQTISVVSSSDKSTWLLTSSMARHSVAKAGLSRTPAMSPHSS